MLKGGIIGFGKVGQSMTRIIREKFPFADIVAVCNRSQAKLDLARTDFGIERLTHDATELCGWDLDFVMVLSGNSAHRAHVEAAAARRLPIFCEKPIATGVADAIAMVRAVETAGVLNHVNYMLRFLAPFQEVRRLYREGTLGRLLSVNMTRLRGFGLYESGARHWAITDRAESGGWVVHHACHGIDFVYWLAGEFKSVYAQTQTTYPGSPELVWGMGRLQNGATAVVADSVCATRALSVTVIGTRGQVMLNADRDAHLTLTHESRDGGAAVTEEIPAISKPYPAFFEDSLAEFFRCLQSGSPSSCTLREACYSLNVAQAMEESAAADRVVKIQACL